MNCVSPGGFYDGQDPRFVERYAARTFLGRMAGLGDLGGVIVFPASDASAYITGTNIPVDGGYTAEMRIIGQTNGMPDVWGCILMLLSVRIEPPHCRNTVCSQGKSKPNPSFAMEFELHWNRRARYTLATAAV